MRDQTIRWESVVGLLSGLLVGAASAATEPMDPTAGLETAAAVERAVVQAIAHREKSVVAIARVRAPEPAAADAVQGAEDRGPRILRPLDPTRPNFVAQQYGSGVVVDRRGLILTAYHLLRPGDAHWVTTADHRIFLATIHAADPRSDLAILAVDVDDLVPIRLGDAEQLKKGQFVIALGNPYAIARDGQASASWGIVANLGRKAGPAIPIAGSAEESTLHHFGTLIQTDARLTFSTSGGALINLRGEMVGLTTAVAATAGYEQAAGYAIPIDAGFRRIIEILEEGREVEYGLLGVRPRNLTPGALRHGKRGVVVGEVVPGTPAARTGLEPMDVITRINDRPIQDADQLILEVNRLLAGTTARLAVDRSGRTKHFTVSLAKYPVHDRPIVTRRLPAWRGLRVDYATAAGPPQDPHLGNVDLAGCVFISAVDKQSAAWRQGLRAGMYISHVEGRRVSSPQQFRMAVAAHTGAVQLRLTLPANQRPVRTIPPPRDPAPGR